MRVRYNNQGGMLGATLDSGSGTEAITGLFAVAPSFATLVPPDYVVLTFEPNTANFEIAYLTAYTAGSLNGSILRGQEGTSPATHASGVTWVNAPTVLDFSMMQVVTPNVIANGVTYIVPDNTQVSYSGVIYVQAGGVLGTAGDGVLSWVH